MARNRNLPPAPVAEPAAAVAPNPPCTSTVADRTLNPLDPLACQDCGYFSQHAGGPLAAHCNHEDNRHFHPVKGWEPGLCIEANVGGQCRLHSRRNQSKIEAKEN